VVAVVTAGSFTAFHYHSDAAFDLLVLIKEMFLVNQFLF